MQGSKIRAITLGFEEFAGTAEDEIPLAAEVAKRYGAEHVVRRVNAREFRQDLPDILNAMDQPSIDGVNTWFVAKSAKEAGLKVALSGLGGDELLAGYPSFQDIPNWRRRYGRAGVNACLGPLRPCRRAEPCAQSWPAGAQRLSAFSNILGPGQAAYLLRRGLFLPHELPAILGKDMARDGFRRLRPLQLISKSLEPDPGNDQGRVCALEILQLHAKSIAERC